MLIKHIEVTNKDNVKPQGRDVAKSRSNISGPFFGYSSAKITRNTFQISEPSLFVDTMIYQKHGKMKFF